jgi:hypothetical protein
VGAKDGAPKAEGNAEGVKVVERKRKKIGGVQKKDRFSKE